MALTRTRTRARASASILTVTALAALVSGTGAFHHALPSSAALHRPLRSAARTFTTMAAPRRDGTATDADDDTAAAGLAAPSISRRSASPAPA